MGFNSPFHAALLAAFLFYGKDPHKTPEPQSNRRRMG